MSPHRPRIAISLLTLTICASCAQRSDQPMAMSAVPLNASRTVALARATSLPVVVDAWIAGDHDRALREAAAMDPADHERLRIDTITQAQYAALTYDQQTQALAAAHARQQAWGALMYAMILDARRLAHEGRDHDARSTLTLIRAVGEANSTSTHHPLLHVHALFGEALIRQANEEMRKLAL